MGSFTRDSLSIALFDRDNLFSDLPPADESDYLPRRPTEKEFHDCCNEFWWVSTYVAKGLWRDQLTYSRYMLDVIVRGQLIRMLSWHAALLSGFQKNLGANGKYLQQYVSKEVWEALRRTYCSADEQAAWGALLEMSDLFDKMAASVAESLEICFSNAEGKQVTGYLKHIKELPRDSKTIYS
jgi:aminoglycoside 6-adenylyltransferase